MNISFDIKEESRAWVNLNHQCSNLMNPSSPVSLIRTLLLSLYIALSLSLSLSLGHPIVRAPKKASEGDYNKEDERVGGLEADDAFVGLVMKR